MCLAIPAKVTELKEGGLAAVDILGVTREISVDLTPQVGIGSYVLVHAGFAIEVVSEEHAQETLDLIREFPELVAEDMPGGEEPVESPLAGLAALMDEDLAADGEVDAADSADASAAPVGGSAVR